MSMSGGPRGSNLGHDAGGSIKGIRRIRGTRPRAARFLRFFALVPSSFLDGDHAARIGMLAAPSRGEGLAVFRSGLPPLVIAVLGAWSLAPASLAGENSPNPFASRVLQFVQGNTPFTNLANPATALGEPSRRSLDPVYGDSNVNPFSPAYLPDQIVSIGPGGSLTVQFDRPVTDDPNNPFGIDLLTFGNSGYQVDFATGRARGLFGNNSQGLVEVSADGLSWFTVPGARPDGAFPTLGFSDVLDPFDPTPGSVLADFTKPVNPIFNAWGLTHPEILAAYNGSGGGSGIDLASVGLSSISFVRVSLPVTAAGNLEIDAFSDVSPVPSPATIASLVLALGVSRRRRVPS